MTMRIVLHREEVEAGQMSYTQDGGEAEGVLSVPAAITKCQTQGLKQQAFISWQFWRLGVQDQGVDTLVYS